VQAHTRNYAHAIDVAKLLKVPYMTIHTPLDEIGRKIENMITEERPAE
jgi:hypothetical protein